MGCTGMDAGGLDHSDLFEQADDDDGVEQRESVEEIATMGRVTQAKEGESVSKVESNETSESSWRMLGYTSAPTEMRPLLLT
jgi:hypothetical protein